MSMLDHKNAAPSAYFLLANTRADTGHDSAKAKRFRFLEPALSPRMASLFSRKIYMDSEGQEILNTSLKGSADG